jgi:hypothetical protein
VPLALSESLLEGVAALLEGLAAPPRFEEVPVPEMDALLVAVAVGEGAQEGVTMAPVPM